MSDESHQLLCYSNILKASPFFCCPDRISKISHWTMYLPMPLLSHVSDSKLFGAHCSVYSQVLWIQPFNSMNFALLSLAGPFPLMSAIGQRDVYFLLLWFLLYRFLIMIFPSNSRILFFKKKKKPQCGRVPLIGIFRFVMFKAVMFWTSYTAVYCFSTCFFIPPNYQMYCILHCFNLLH